MIATRYRDRVELLLEEREREEMRPTDTTNWTEITEVVTKAAEDICGIQEKKIENPWMAGRDEEIQRMRARITGCLTQRNDCLERKGQERDAVELLRLETELDRIKTQLKEARTELQSKT